MPRKSAVLLASLLLASSLAVTLGQGCALLPTETPEEASIDTDLLQEVWDILHEDYVEPDQVDDEALIRGALKGMVDGLGDPYSAYLDADAVQMSLSDLAGKFEGIGAWVGADDGRIIVIAPIPGSPADQAGIRPGDVIMGVDGESTADMSVMDAVLLIRGPSGTAVKLLVLHEGDEEPVEIEIVRAEIDLPSVHLEMVGDIAHITITNFSERTDDELDEVMKEVAEQSAKGIVLDLRYNPGGMLSTVVEVAGRFLDKGVVVSVVDNEGNKRDSEVRRRGRATALPMVVLVNSFSASGSEVLAGALQDHGRAVVAGAKTFGKGSVNVLRRLSDGSGIYLTVARWYTPAGRLIEGEGIEPDFELDPEEDALAWAIDYLKSSNLAAAHQKS